MEVQSHLLLLHQPREHLPVLSVLLEVPPPAPAWPSAPGGLRLRLPLEEEGLFVSGALAVCSAGSREQIRGPAPNPACWVLQGSEQLIMNLIKGEQEPQSDLGFSL